MKRSSIVSLMVAFLFATTFSSALSFSISSYFNKQEVTKEIRADEMSIAQNFIRLYTQNGIDAESLCIQLSTSMYEISQMTAAEAGHLSEDTRSLVSNGDIVLISPFFRFEDECVFKIDDKYISVHLNGKSTVIKSYSSRIGLILSLSLLLSAIIMFFASRSITKPIRELCKATKKVGKGDFDFKVDIETKNTEIAQLSHSFNDMLTELKSNELLKKDFISNVSHEFKTPLATVNGFATLLKDGNCTQEEIAEYAGIIEHETARLSVLCGNILNLSKIENQKIVRKNIAYRLDEQLRNVILVLQPLWEKKNILLDVDIDDAEYYGDEELLEQVWMNLINNAVKFTDDGGTVTVELHELSEKVIVTVKDTGIGMSDETKKHIFEKFYQADPAHSTNGNGLGLALVKEILDFCGGSITVTSEVGKGSCFTVVLPKAEKE